jgi:hypothetical protein
MVGTRMQWERKKKVRKVDPIHITPDMRCLGFSSMMATEKKGSIC